MSQTDILIRPVEPEDWPDVAEIFDQPGVIGAVGWGRAQRNPSTFLTAL